MHFRWLPQIDDCGRGFIRRYSSARGQIIPLYALGAAALFGMGALAIDVGYARYQQRAEQSAADSAAIAGAIELIYSSADYKLYAANDATTNGGYTDDGGVTTTVTTISPPITGFYAGNLHAVQVTITRKQPLFFGGVFPGATFPVSVSAVARNDAPGNGSGCVVTLKSTLTINGGAGGFLVPKCGVVADAGMTINGKGIVTAQFIGVAAPNSVPNCGGCTAAFPTQSIAAPDPCPTITSCEYLLTHAPSGLPQNPSSIMINGVTHFYPGEYTTTFSPGTAILEPGLYQLDLGMTAGGSDTITVDTAVSPKGVTLYNKGGAITFSGNASIDLIAPSTGPYAGVSVFQPSTNVDNKGKPSPVVLNGGGTYGVSGMIYAPTADVTLNGNNPSVSELIVGSMTVNGGGISVDAVGSGNPSNELGITHVVLAE